MRGVSKTEFFRAVCNWQADEVAAAIRERPNFVSIVDNTGRTALHLCARQAVSGAADSAASVSTAKVLVKGGADVNAVQPIPDDGEVFPATALWYAFARGRNRPLARYLLKHGADPNHCMFALVYADDLPSVKLVRRYNAQLDEVFDGETPLIYATRHRRAKFTEWLLREGADTNFRDRRGFTALHHAVRRRMPDSTLRALLRHGADTKAKSTGGVSVGELATRAQKAVLGIDDVR